MVVVKVAVVVVIDVLVVDVLFAVFFAVVAAAVVVVVFCCSGRRCCCCFRSSCFVFCNLSKFITRLDISGQRLQRRLRMEFNKFIFPRNVLFCFLEIFLLLIANFIKLK